MAFTSYPPSGVDFTSAQWSDYLDRADGILSEGPNTFTLSLSSTDNTCTVVRHTGTSGEVSRVRVGGFLGEMTSNTALTLAAAVGSPVTYHLGFKYDPAQHANANGPISLVSFTGTFDESAGARFLPIWDVTRSPSQSLNLAATVDKRVFLRHTITILNEAALPAASSLLAYTEARLRPTAGAGFGNTIYQIQHTGSGGARQWEKINSPDPIAFPMNSPAIVGVPNNRAPVYTLGDDGWVDAWGWLQRSSGNLNTGANVGLGTFPAGARPGNRHNFMVAGVTPSGYRSLMVYIESDGGVWLADSSVPTGSSVSTLNLDGIRFRVEN